MSRCCTPVCRINIIMDVSLYVYRFPIFFESSDDYALSKDVDVALRLDYQAFNKKEPLRDALDFVIVNTCLHDDFDEFKRKEIESDYSYLRVNELLLHYIVHDCGHLRERIVTKYGLTYLKLNGDQIDHLCRWIKTKRDCIRQDGFGTFFKDSYYEQLCCIHI